MAHLLHQKNVRIKKRIFMTATERLFRGDSDEFMSMDDPRDYGSLIYELSFKEAINSKPPIISDYKIVTFGITTPEIEEIYQSNKYLEVKKILKDITAREFATAIALRKAIKKLKIKNAISFHRSIRRADNFRVQQDLITKIFPSYGKLKSFHVRGDMPTSDRAIQMRNFAEGEGLMTNARCLTEGVDLPAIDCVVFTDPKRSKVDIVQAAGRALRLSKGKKFGYILIPIFIPAGADFIEAAEEQGFDDIAVTVRALATTDTRITEYLRVISEGKKPKGGSPVDGLTSVNSLYKIEAEKFDKAIKLKVWDRIALTNLMPFSQAKSFLKNFKFKNQADFHEAKSNNILPKDIPYNPNRYYNEWLSWGDFLSHNYVHPSKRNYLNYAKAVKLLSKLNLQSRKDFMIHYNKGKIPISIPKGPDGYYKRRKEWTNWGHFIGTDQVATQDRKYEKFEVAKKIIKNLNLKSKSDFEKKYKDGLIPKNIPIAVYKVYKKKWKGFGDFLGTGTIAPHKKIYLDYEEAIKIIHPLKISSMNEYKKKYNEGLIPENIPKIPRSTYIKKDKWVSDGHFLGNNSVIYKQAKDLANYQEAKKFIKKMKISGQLKFRELVKKGKMHNKIPNAPYNFYSRRGQWKSWPDFLGKKTKS
jgi:superfamily II DNA/RNA helicase